mmetsp:Transcript_68502/g.108722  ORF Transcript_68502/g.108722 Transcript_68502/m.108722 type:complete len:116 (-) Transcript_68502:76-423(-)|eukprot:CAMPEP_0169118082 /NCGR_PEP_ID=MMETSP1015-20121227/30807_1 /TAXON_ID=342587 /ORGANISM="Karlodinium micrum, Strain CCMP2283" /LENGTH=115 /DNA_ID=CAMNT_0009180819 /DNA_START=55 /DNA_END=402 /DNA_ORIENTATION=+
MRFFLLVAMVFSHEVVGVVWIKGAGGSSCETVCAARGGCDETAWPKSEEEFAVAAKAAGQSCETTQAGGATYDPSTDGLHCGWQGDEHSEASRCEVKPGDDQTYRFCPCFAEKDL